MVLRLRTDSFLDFVAQEAERTPKRPTPNPRGICIVSGAIVQQNLREELNRQQYPTARLADITTIESLATDLLKPTAEPHQILNDAYREELIFHILTASDPDETDLQLTDFPASGRLETKTKEDLQTLTQQFPYEKKDAREALLDELDDYYRCTDAGTEADILHEILDDMDDVFPETQSRRSITSFDGLTTLMVEQLNKEGLDRQLSRSHLVNAARSVIGVQWPEQFKHIEWITVSSISIFDNPTLRFLAELGTHSAPPDIDVFCRSGSVDYNQQRFDTLPVETDVHSASDSNAGIPESAEVNIPSTAGTKLVAATQGTVESFPDNVRFVEAPNDRRLVERIANDVRQRIQDGAEPSNFLLVAPDAGAYRTIIEDAFETVGLPIYVQTRRPMANIPAYRYLRSFVTLIEKSEQDEPITHGELMDPLRLGYAPKSSDPDRWPLAGQEFTQIEQRLHLEQQKYNSEADRYPDQGIPFDDWREIISGIYGDDADWAAVHQLLNDVENWHDNAPSTGDELAEELGRYLGTYVHHTVDHERQLYEGPAIDTTRTAITQTHATNLAERVRDQLDTVGVHYDGILSLDVNREPGWSEVGRTLSALLGGDTFGKQQMDRNAIPLVDAGNSYYRSAEIVYVLGMNAEEFPAEPPTPTFLHSSVRQAVHEKATSGVTPFFHFDGRATTYGQALDYYEATLAAGQANAEFVFHHTFRDSRGNDVEWSPFVDIFELDEVAERIDVGEWLAQPAVDDEGNLEETWASVGNRVSSRERLRTLLYNAYRDRPEKAPPIDSNSVTSLTNQLDQTVLRESILPRFDRYHHPPISTTIEASEPAFDTIDYHTVSGSPHYPHELDLLSQCGLKYYYYQFLYNFEGRDPERERIPYYSSNYPHHRLGDLPYLVRENHADPRYVDKWETIITELLPERQSETNGLAQFHSATDLRQWFGSQELFNEYDESTLLQNLEAERRLVAAEQDAGVERKWEWRTGGIITINGHELAVPPYRADRFDTDNGLYYLPIFFTRFSDRARSAFKGCWEHEETNIWEITEHCQELCIECADENCTYNSKYTLDHRLIAGREFETGECDNKVNGVGLQEQYGNINDGSRFIVIKSNHMGDIYGGEGAVSNVETIQPRGGYGQWYDNKVDSWKDDFTAHAERLAADPAIQLTTNDELVTEDECLRCVYKDLCMVPDRGVIDQ